MDVKSLMMVMGVAITLEGFARILPETLVVSQCEFYPLREQPRGYLGRYADQPLFVDPDLPTDPDREGIPAHPTWGSFHSQADWEAAQQLGKDYGLDGFSFFPAEHRARYWKAIEESRVADFLSVPVVTFMLRRLDEDVDAIGRAINSRGGYRFNGKTLLLSYWTDRVNAPDQLDKKLAMAREKFGDRFLFITDITALSQVDEYLQTGSFSAETTARRKQKLRDYLRVSDGIYIGDTFSLIRFDRGDRVFDGQLYGTIVKEMQDVLDEPEFRGKKLLALSALMAHENATIQFWTPRANGLRTLIESMETAIAAEPDVLVLPEWDEFNENTSFCPTLYNGLTTKRVVRNLLARLRRQPLSKLSGDDSSRPNLIVSYRKTVAPGERLFVDVLNVPDGSRSGELECRIEFVGDTGKVLADFPYRVIREDALESVRFESASEELSQRARTLDVRLMWRKGSRSGSIMRGLHHIDLLPGSAWNLREVRQAIRDLAPLEKSKVCYSNGVISAELSCAEPIRYAMVTGNGWIQRVVGRDDSPAARFIEDDESAVFKIDGYSFTRIDGDFAYRVEGSAESEWYDWKGVVTGNVFKVDWVYSVGEPVYLKIRKEDMKNATLAFDFPNVSQRKVSLQKAFDEGAFVVGVEKRAQISVVRLARQSRYPSALNKNECVFSFHTDRDCKSMSYNVQVVTMTGKTWRSQAFVDEEDCGRATMKVYSTLTDSVTDVKLPAARVPFAAYDFSDRAGLYVPVSEGYRRLATTLGGPCSIVSLWNRCSSSRNDVPEGVKLACLTNPVPLRLTDDDGYRELVFDGVDDYITFPWEILPRGAGFRISFDVLPEETEGRVALFASKNLFSLWMECGELKVRYSTGQSQGTGVFLKKGLWNLIQVGYDCERLTFDVDGARASVDAVAPAAMTSSLIFGLPNKSDIKPFRGRLRNLVFDHATRREPKPENVPELMRFADGKAVKTLTDWTRRREEIRETFRKNVYGRRPEGRPRSLSFERLGTDVTSMGGKAIRKRVRISWSGPCGWCSFPVTAFIPVRTSPCPAFLLVCNRNPSKNIDPDRRERTEFWPAEEIVGRGYAAVAFWNGDVAVDDKNAAMTNGVFSCYRKSGNRNSDDWGSISAWGWAASRVLDWLEAEPTVDASHVAVVGHSRGGKTALWCAAEDERFAMACVNDSGCSGAKLNHIDLPLSEDIRTITEFFPHWFCRNYAAYAGRDRKLPFDQHEVLSLLAPRLLCVASATKDFWAGQRGEYWSALLASPAWELYGKRGLVSAAFPVADCPQQDGCVSYHMRTGVHTLTKQDWNWFMDFADKHGWCP